MNEPERKLDIAVYISPSKGTMRVEGVRENICAGEWAIITVDFLRHVTVMLNQERRPGIPTDPNDVFEILCETFRASFGERPNLGSQQPDEIMVMRWQVRPDGKTEFRVRPVPFALIVWARFPVDLMWHFKFTPEEFEEFKQIFDAEIEKPTGGVHVHAEKDRGEDGVC